MVAIKLFSLRLKSPNDGHLKNYVTVIRIYRDSTLKTQLLHNRVRNSYEMITTDIPISTSQKDLPHGS